MKRYASQSRTNVLRSTSISPLILPKQRQNTLQSRHSFQRPSLQSTNTKSSYLIEKRNSDRQNQRSRLTSREANYKSTQLVSYTSIIPTTNKPLTSNTPSQLLDQDYLIFQKLEKNFFFLVL